MKRKFWAPSNGYAIFIGFQCMIVCIYGIFLLTVYHNENLDVNMFITIMIVLFTMVLPTYLLIAGSKLYLLNITVDEKSISERAYLVKRREFYWSEVTDIGIGIHPIQYYKNINIYISRRAVSEYEMLHLFDMRKDNNVMIVRYNKKVYEAIKKYSQAEIKNEQFIHQIDNLIIK